MNAMFIGAMSSGKTTLIQRLTNSGIKYDKTQAIEYVRTESLFDESGNGYIDTPGEYMQVRSFWCSLTVTSCDADVICLVQDSTSEDCWFSGGISCNGIHYLSDALTYIVEKYKSQHMNEYQYDYYD